VATGSAAAVVDGGVGEVPGLLLHDKKCIRSMPRHEKEDELPWSDGLPKRAGGPTMGPTSPQATHGLGAPLGHVHEERGTIRRAIQGNRSRENRGVRW
jgi:hypothetical protein